MIRWVDRLGRNYADVTETVREFMRRGVFMRTVINSMIFDGATTDPVQMAVRDALIGFMAATAQVQAEATKEAQRAGIEYAKEREDAYADSLILQRVHSLSWGTRLTSSSNGGLQTFGVTKLVVRTAQDLRAVGGSPMGFQQEEAHPVLLLSA
ncbi:hypothetical protein GOFOIKOB_6483 [Methylobacterium tardum]|uniref:Resolvase/invertase-type recombinase catalytic domain-containing protein n=1 Tax=Methylobacterium tardum TaxID=374432 RepID=A0AA37WNS5_9HYPH|nr:hypothetical protein GOFOIKOB_6483 [Methylobacterium tardum]GLS68095.1 hypothetical protein GCM10007890_01060 [Methylobacterium tardum]